MTKIESGAGGISRGRCLDRMREGLQFGKSGPGLEVQLELRAGEERKPEMV